MKLTVRNLLLFLMCIMSKLYPYSLSEKFRGYRNHLYTLWIRNFVGEVGKNTCFSRPILLQGGGQRRIRIGSNTTFGHHCILGCWERYGEAEHYKPEIIISDNCSIGEYCHITAINKITIGNGFLTGRFVYIGDNAHGGLSREEANIQPNKRRLRSKGEIIIGNNVWVGDKVTILGGVTIGDNVIVGANSVVLQDLPSNCMAAGSPAKIIKVL